MLLCNLLVTAVAASLLLGSLSINDLLLRHSGRWATAGGSIGLSPPVRRLYCLLICFTGSSQGKGSTFDLVSLKSLEGRASLGVEKFVA